MLPLMFTSVHSTFEPKPLAIHQLARSARLPGMHRQGRAGMQADLDGPQPEHLNVL
jgi:hypothetical protein